MMANFDEGVIKFTIDWQESEPVSHPSLPELIDARNELFKSGLIGVYDDGIGYGNISCRANENQFIISGTQTGHIALADKNQFCLVVSCDIDANKLNCSGPVKASSESMSHYAFYVIDNSVQCVIHVHNKALWNDMMYKVPTIDESIQYGTPGMAIEIMRIVSTQPVTKAIVTLGHQDGVFVYGASIEEAMFNLTEF